MNGIKPYHFADESGTTIPRQTLRVLRTLTFPSPRPSPLGRGSRGIQSPEQSRRFAVSRRSVRFSLSFGERAGVRGNRARFSKRMDDSKNLQASPVLLRSRGCP